MAEKTILYQKDINKHRKIIKKRLRDGYHSRDYALFVFSRWVRILCSKTQSQQCLMGGGRIDLVTVH